MPHNKPGHTLASSLVEKDFFHMSGEQLAKAIHRLSLRIEERFPKASLLGICRDLERLAMVAEKDAERARKINIVLRVGVVVFVAMIVYVFSRGLSPTLDVISMTGLLSNSSGAEMVQALESLLNSIVFIGAALVFLFSIENRIQRQRVILLVNRLRGLAHAIDLHQLSKDPVVFQIQTPVTASSPERPLNPFLTSRYLVYCSELLSFTSKVSFLYVQDVNDSESVEAVNELEQLTTGLSTKIWQKLLLLSDD